MGPERLRVLLVADAIDREVARLAPVHLRDLDEVHVVDDVRQDDLLDLQRRRHEIEQRRIAEVGLEDARLEDAQPGAQAALLLLHLGDLALDLARLAEDLVELR